MNAASIRARVVAVLTAVAPDVAADAIEPTVRFRDQFDFDSMDFLNFAIGLHRAFGIEIPEADYPRLQSLADAIAYLQQHQPGGPLP